MTRSALHLYQRALQLDAIVAEQHSEGVDWYNYGLFLQSAGFPRRLAYASLLKSQSLLKPSPDAPEAQAFHAILHQLETQLGADAASIRRNPTAAQKEALTISR